MRTSDGLPYVIDVGVALIMIFVIVAIDSMSIAYPRLFQASLLSVAAYFLIESIGDVLERLR
jgi:hypothetical protein|tara:strand:+ start:359 stop:544 length:186 start_codon:yes stop_codon:yes gene_type:complete